MVFIPLSMYPSINGQGYMNETKPFPKAMRSVGLDHKRKGFCMSPADFHGAFFVLSIAFGSADSTKKMIQSSFIEEHNIGLCIFFSPEAKVRQTIDMCFCPFFPLKHR